MKSHHIRGVEIDLAGAPEQSIESGIEVKRSAIFASDYPGLTLEALVAEGATVLRGDPVLADRIHKEIRVTAPVAGTITQIMTGAKRRVSMIEIACAGDAGRTFEIDDTTSRDAVARLCQQSGLWAAFLERPLGRVPTPGQVPSAIFVTAIESEPLCADSSVILARFDAAFRAGAQALKTLTDGPVFVCQALGPGVAKADERLRVERFSGPHPAGLPGTHIDRLWPQIEQASVWQIHYQDVIALGTVLATGLLPATRVVALGGEGLREPRLVEIPSGAALADVLEGEIGDGQFMTLSGSPLSGRESSHLRSRHWQICVLRRPRPPPPARGWWTRRAAKPRVSPVIPTRALDRALGPRLNVVPMIRALSVGDAETANRLGCRRLLEEDLALASYVTGGAMDFGALLRKSLDMLEEVQ